MKQDWKYTTLGNKCNIYQPQTISTKDMVVDGKYAVYGANGIIGRYNQYNHEQSEVLLTCRGNTCGTINVSEPFSWINGNAMVVSPKDDTIIKPFLKYTLLAIDYSQVITGAAQPQITRQSLAPALFSYPSTTEQQRIVGILDAEFEKIDALKANAEENLQNAKDLFQAALKKELEPKDGWMTATFSDLYDVRDGTHDSPKYVSKGYPFVTSKNLIDGRIDLSDVRYISQEDYDSINARSKVDVGDVLFAMIGSNLGHPALVEDEPNYAIKNVALFKVPSKQSSRLLLYLLSSNTVMDVMNKEKNGSSQPFVSLKYLRNFVVTIPPSYQEQESLAEEIHQIDIKCKVLQNNYTQTIALCDDLKQALLRKAFSGEL